MCVSEGIIPSCMFQRGFLMSLPVETVWESRSRAIFRSTDLLKKASHCFLLSLGPWKCASEFCLAIHWYWGSCFRVSLPVFRPFRIRLPVVFQVDLPRAWCSRMYRLDCFVSRFYLRMPILVVGVWILCLRSSLCDPVPPSGFLHFHPDGWELSDVFLNMHLPTLRFRGLWFANVSPDGFAFGRSLCSLPRDTFRYL